MPARERRERVRRLFAEIGLEDRKPPKQSGGQQRRVAVARAVLAEPALVLADEPTANLDSTMAEALLDVMEKLNREEGTTFVFSTHEPSVMERAGRLIRLVDGRVEGWNIWKGRPLPADHGLGGWLGLRLARVGASF